MNFLDYIILGIVLIGFLLGFKDGLIRKIIGLAGFIIAVFLVIEFSGPLGVFLTPYFNDEQYLAEIVSGIFIFFGALVVTAIIKRVIHPVDKVNKFVNQILGGIAGGLQVSILLSGIFLVLNIAGVPSSENKKNSALYSSFFNIIPKSATMIMGENSRTNYYIDEIMNGRTPVDSLKKDSQSVTDVFKKKNVADSLAKLQEGSKYIKTQDDEKKADKLSNKPVKQNNKKTNENKTKIKIKNDKR